MAKRVLVIDRDPSTRSGLAAVLETLGIDADEAADGSGAIVKLHDRRYSVVVIDLALQASEGFSLLKELRRLDQRPAPVVLALLGGEGNPPIPAGDAKVIHGIIRKPVDVRELAAVIEACAEVRARMNLEAMALATMIAGGPLFFG